MMLTIPLTHIAAVTYLAGAYRVHGVYPRGTENLKARHPGTHWMFVPSTVKKGDEVLTGPGVTTYADPVWAEWYATKET